MILWVAVSGRLDIQWFSYKLPLLLLLLPGLTGELNKTVGEGRQGNCPQKHKFPRQWNWLPMGDKNCMQEKKMGFKKKKGNASFSSAPNICKTLNVFIRGCAWRSCFNCQHSCWLLLSQACELVIQCPAINTRCSFSFDSLCLSQNIVPFDSYLPYWNRF